MTGKSTKRPNLITRHDEDNPGAHADPGQWVEVRTTVLQAGARAPQVPPDTQEVALQMRVRGTAEHSGTIGEIVRIRTAAGRLLSGELAMVEPAYAHGFGVPDPALIGIDRELRELLAQDGPSDD